MTKYTVQQLARLANITVRTLHYYDEIGLLKPSFIEENGYRYYEEKELLRLQQILFFRELEFTLADIKAILNSKKYNQKDALSEQKKLLELKRKRVAGLIKTIDDSLKTGKGGGNMQTIKMFSGFSDADIQKYKDEAKKRWGDTQAWKQSEARTKHWTNQDYKQEAERVREFTKILADNMLKGYTSDEFQRLIDQHYQSIQKDYDCPLDMYKSLGELYVQDPKFTKYYDSVRPGLAEFMREAINYYVSVREKKK